MTDTLLQIQGLTFNNLTQLQGGRNNRVFRAESSSGNVLVKQYFYSPSDIRDRLKSEFSMLTFLRDNNEKSIPEPLISDSETHTGIYQFIEGSPVNSDSITKQDVISLAALLTRMWQLRDLPGAQYLPIASEACFSIKEYVLKIEKRFFEIQQITSNNDLISNKVLRFINNSLYPLFTKIVRHAESQYSNYIDILAPTLRTLSPSDHGFHNAIRTRDGSLFFIDFEYAGWDDPVKMICDSLLQPDKPIPESLRSLFLENTITVMYPIENFIKRIEYLYPLLGIKWCLIMLNEFLPVSESRRRFSGEKTGELLKEHQLDRSMNLYSIIKRHFEQKYITTLIKNSIQ